MIAPLPLFINRKDVVIFLALLVLVFALHVGYSYKKYLNFLEQDVFHGTLIYSQLKFNKNNKIYFSFQIQTKDFKLFSTRWGEEFEFRDRVSLGVVKSKVSFYDFFKGSFYAPTYSLAQLEDESLRQKITQYITTQHQSEKLESLYLALYLAKPINQELREDVNRFGVAHLVAISGFHLGVILSFGYLLLGLFYRFFQDRFFPYRNRHFDLAVVMFLSLLGYLFLIDFAPSFLRAFAMALVGFVFLNLHVKILSFETLLLCALMLLSFFPRLFFQIGFWLSVGGVFYIFLYLKWFENSLNKYLHVVIINSYIFFCMNLIVHFWFGVTSFFQLFSIPLSVIFLLFYPLSALLHVVGFGGVFDGVIYDMFGVQSEVWGYETPLWLLGGYLFLSVVAIRYRLIAFILPIFGVIPFCMV